MDIELFVKSQKCTKYAQVNLHHLVLEYLYFLSADEQEIREIKHRVFFSRERQRGSRDLTFPAFAVCRSPFLLEEDIFPVWRERENVCICSPFLLSISPF